MKSTGTLLLLAITLVLGILACDIGGQTPSASALNAAATVVSMTLQAQGTSAPAAALATPSSSPVPATATTKPALTIKTNKAACRNGPGPNYDLVASYSTGTVVDMIAKDTADGYWLVKDPASGSSCWVKTLDATPGGSFDLLPEVTPAANASNGAPAAPTVFYPNYTCDATTLTNTLKWNDAADNENGYRLYRDGSLIADLPANTTTFFESFTFTFGSQLTYAIEAYNDLGTSSQRTLTFHCP
jgi:hypothetical protein